MAEKPPREIFINTDDMAAWYTTSQDAMGDEEAATIAEYKLVRVSNYEHTVEETEVLEDEDSLKLNQKEEPKA